MGSKLRNSRIQGGKNVVPVEEFKNFISGGNLGLTGQEARKLGDAFKISDGSFSGKGDVVDLD